MYRYNKVREESFLHRRREGPGTRDQAMGRPGGE